MTTDRPKELEAFNEYYTKLCNTLTDIDKLLPHFVTENIIEHNHVQEINAVVTERQKVQKFLTCIVDSIRAGNTKAFYVMLRIMEEYGPQDTQQLADQIRKSMCVDKVTSCNLQNDQNISRPQDKGYTMYWTQVIMMIMTVVVVVVALLVMANCNLVKGELSTNANLEKQNEKATDSSELKNKTITQITVDNEYMNTHYSITSMNFKVALSHIHCLASTNWTHYLVEQSSESKDQVMPIILSIRGNVEDILWQSNAFYISEGGYWMRMRVYLNGYGDGKDTYVSVYLHLVKGPHDDKLEQSGHWPLRGSFTIELLNQLNDTNHYSTDITYSPIFPFECNGAVTESDIAIEGWGKPKFISHDSLLKKGNYYYCNDTLYFRVSYHDIGYQTTPAILVMPNFIKKWKNKERWLSSPFFALKGRYKMRLRIDTAGYGEGENTHVSVYLYLMKGPHDNELERSGHWPLRGIFTIELLNHFNDNDHYSHMLQFHHYHCSECTNRVLEGDIADVGWGEPQFISHDTLLHYSKNGYHNNVDCLIFRISYEDMEPPYRVAPVTFKLTKFSQWLKSKQQWYSSSFFTREKGYLLSLTVYAAGFGKGEGTHVSVYLHLMKGPHDNELEQSGHWPLRGTFKIELLNQLNDSDHYSRIIQLHYHHCNDCTNRVLEKDTINKGWGIQKFVPHSMLIYKNHYYNNDSLLYRIFYEDMEPPYQVAPVAFKLTNFFLWFSSGEHWYSTPFFAFEEGYLMYLNVYIRGDSRRAVSVYLHLMKGSYDDKLEQLGRWPLRGTFTIELLDQLSGNNYSQEIIFNNHTDGNYTIRVMEAKAEQGGWGLPRFISHNVLFEYNYFIPAPLHKYLNNNTLHFRVSYRPEETGDTVVGIIIFLIILVICCCYYYNVREIVY